MSTLFEEGTEVEVIREGDNHFGERGEVTNVEGQGTSAEYEVTFDGDDIAFYTEHDLVSV